VRANSSPAVNFTHNGRFSSAPHPIHRYFLFLKEESDHFLSSLITPYLIVHQSLLQKLKHLHENKLKLFHLAARERVHGEEVSSHICLHGRKVESGFTICVLNCQLSIENYHRRQRVPLSAAIEGT
jgi:hypothetical protein